VNFAETELAGTVTEAGTVRSAVVSLIATTVPPEGATLESVTVQDVLAFAATLAGAQVTAETTGGAGMVNDAVAEEPVSDAVRVTDRSAEHAPAVTLKVPAVEPTGTITDAGTLKVESLELSATVAPPELGAALRLREQLDEAPGITADGLQVTELTVTVGDGGAPIAPSVPEKARVEPSCATPIALLKPITADVAVVASLTVTLAATPFAIVWSSRP
jgi:hypothetical protein